MDNFPFIGRKAELQRLEDLLKKKTASLVVIRPYLWLCTSHPGAGS
jgi:hypothetical protein